MALRSLARHFRQITEFVTCSKPLKRAERRPPVASAKQTQAARTSAKKAQQAARIQRTIANMPSRTRTALGEQGAAVAQRKRAGSGTPRTRAELYEVAKQRDLPGLAQR